MTGVLRPVTLIRLMILTCVCWDLSRGSEQIHLSLGEDASEMIVTWVTQEKPVNRSTIAFGKKGEELEDRTGYWTKFKSGFAHWIFVHRVLLQDLEPGVVYEYFVKDNNHWSRKYSFRTFDFDETGREPRIVIFGDMGTHNARAVPSLRRHAEKRNMDAVFHIGDIAYDLWDDEGRMADNFMRLIEPIAARVPYQVLPGNHEEHHNFSHYNNLFSMTDAGTGEANNFYYSMNMGPVHIICLTTDFYFLTQYGTGQIIAQYNWLIGDLREATRPEVRKQRPWIIVLSHREMYCSSALDLFRVETLLIREGFRGEYGLEKVMHDFKVDVFFAGHVHLYERIFPVYKEEVVNTSHPFENPERVVHIVTGAAGCVSGLTPFLSPQPIWSAVRLDEYSYTNVTANLTAMRIQQVSVEVSSCLT